MNPEVAERTQFLVSAAHRVKQSGVPNYIGCHIVLPSKFNFEFLYKELEHYQDRQVIDFLKFGFPVDCQLVQDDPGIPANHSGATDFPDEINALINKEV